MPITLRPLSKYRHRLLAIGVLVLSTWMSLGLVVVRWIAAGHLFYRNLVWDLFLAWIPFWLSTSVYVLHLRGSNSRRLMLSLSAAWLLFFPNAPYLLTEFVHLNRLREGVWWCDLLVMIGFAWNGVALGLLSLYTMQIVVRARFGKWRSWWLAAIVLLLGSFGVTLGRFERFNSWDIIRHPFTLAASVTNQFIHPATDAKHLATMLLLCMFLTMAYLLFWALVTLHNDERGPSYTNCLPPDTKRTKPSLFQADGDTRFEDIKLNTKKT